MSRLPYFPFYPADWLTSPTVMGMSLAEQGAFLRILCFMWTEEAVDPADIPAILNMEEDAVEEMLAKRCWKQALQVGEDGKLRNERLSLDREATVTKCEMAKKAADARWAKHREAGSPVKRRANAEEEIQNGIRGFEMNEGVSVPQFLKEAMTAYMHSRRQHKRSVWKAFQWIDNLDTEWSFEQWAEAYRTASRVGWNSVHPRKANGKLKGNVGLESLKGWVGKDGAH